LNRLQQTLDKSQEKNEMQFKLVEQHEENKSHLEQEIMQHKLEEQNLRKRNYILEKQKEKAAMNAANYHAQLQEARETIKLKDMEITELQKVIQDEKDQLKKQQNLYEQVRSDRNAYSKAQIQSEDEIAEVILPVTHCPSICIY
jgi:isocitrate dehydrogenase kinase/phosphatase